MPPAIKYPKVGCLSVSATLCIIDSLEQSPETPICPSAAATMDYNIIQYVEWCLLFIHFFQSGSLKFMTLLLTYAATALFTHITGTSFDFIYGGCWNAVWEIIKQRGVKSQICKQLKPLCDKQYMILVIRYGRKDEFDHVLTEVKRTTCPSNWRKILVF